jgi:maltose/maltodextrin transport system permease protein
MFPAVLSLVAYYVLLDYMGQHFRFIGLNTIFGLVVIYLAGISINIWMIKGYFETIPASMEESARIDGASQFQTFLRILLPISAPIFAVVFILSFIYAMSEYTRLHRLCSRQAKPGPWPLEPIPSSMNRRNFGDDLPRLRY